MSLNTRSSETGKPDSVSSEADEGGVGNGHTHHDSILSILSILAHPDADSYCAALFREFGMGVRGAGRGKQLHEASLYELGFNPVMDLSELRRHIPLDQPAMEHLNLVQKARYLALFFPDWWGAEPAILKGWLDRVLRPGAAYQREAMPGLGQNAESTGLLQSLNLSVWITSDTARDGLQRLEGLYRERYRHIIGDFCGLRGVNIFLCSPIRDSGIRQRRIWLEACNAQGREA